MTREEAIELLEERKKFNRTMQRGWEQSEGVTASGKTVNTASFAKQHKDEADALDIALTALRPVRRPRGGEEADRGGGAASLPILRWRS